MNTDESKNATGSDVVETGPPPTRARIGSAITVIAVTLFFYTLLLYFFNTERIDDYSMQYQFQRYVKRDVAHGLGRVVDQVTDEIAMAVCLGLATILAILRAITTRRPWIIVFAVVCISLVTLVILAVLGVMMALGGGW